MLIAPKKQALSDCSWLPAEIKTEPRFMLCDPRTKRPWWGGSGEWRDTRNHADFETAHAAATQKRRGVIWILPDSGGFGVVDLDACYDDAGELRSWAAPIVEHAIRFGLIVERSLSGKGIHVWFRKDPAPTLLSVMTQQTIIVAEKHGEKNEQIESWDRVRAIAIGCGLLEGSGRELRDGAEFVHWLAEYAKPWLKPKPEVKQKTAAIPRGKRGSSAHRRVTAAELRERLGAPASGPVRCPAHDDRNPSCSIDDSTDGTRTLVHCFAGCSPESIAAAAGLTIGDLFEEPPRSAARAPRGGGGAGAGDEAIEGAETPPADPRGRHTIALSRAIGAEDLITSEVLEALAGDPGVFVGPSGRLVEVIERFSPGESPRLEIVPLSLAMVRELISRRVRFINLEDRLERGIPRFSPTAVADRNVYPGFKTLASVSRVPILRHNGSLSIASGFDAESGVLIRPFAGAAPVEIPESPSRGDGLRAIAELCDVVREFDFVDPSDRAAWLAFALTLVGRRAIDGPSPMFVFDSPDQRSGKTLLLKIAGIVALGEQPALRTNTDSAEEQRKAILASLIGGERLLALENVITEIGGAVLAGIITAERWCDRILGSSRTVEVSTKGLTIAASGNGVEVDSDLSRRVIFSRLLPHPENKNFERDFPTWVFENRARLLGAALVALRAFIVAGRPGAREFVPLPSFESWARLIVGALRWYGEPDPSEATRRIARARDSERVRSEVLLTAIEDFEQSTMSGAGGVLVADLADAIERGSETESIRALGEFFGNPVSRSRLGRSLTKLVGSRRFAGRMLVRETARGGVHRYRVVRIGEDGLEREETADDA